MTLVSLISLEDSTMKMRRAIALVLLVAFVVTISGCHMFHKRDKSVVRVCLKCGEVLAEPRGGKGKIKTKITAVIK